MGEYYFGGQIRWSGHYKDDLQEGYWQIFNRDGTVNNAETGNTKMALSRTNISLKVTTRVDKKVGHVVKGKLMAVKSVKQSDKMIERELLILKMRFGIDMPNQETWTLHQIASFLTSPMSVFARLR